MQGGVNFLVQVRTGVNSLFKPETSSSKADAFIPFSCCDLGENKLA
jgi:hypothetical protein